MDNIKDAHCCELVFKFIQYEDGVSAANLTIIDQPIAIVGFAADANLTKVQALEAMRQKLNDEIDRLIKGVADEDD
jgi:hypothetical protein